MRTFIDVRDRSVRLTEERRDHLETAHPEMSGQIERVGDVLQMPDRILESRTDSSVELYYRFYDRTPVTQKYLCAVVKNSGSRGFIVTAYFTDTIKKGESVWPTK